MNNIKLSNKLLIVYLFVFHLITSCQKNQQEILLNGEAEVSVNIQGFNFDTELYANSANKKENNNPIHIQYASEEFRLKSQLNPISSNEAKNNLKDSKLANTPTLKELGNGIRYILLVYDTNKKLVASKEYVYGQETLQSSIKLYSNVRYSFVAVSARSTSVLPTISNVNNLDDAKINNVNADLLYLKDDRVLTVGQNFLAAILKPQFSEITTTLEMDPNMTGKINAIVNPKFNLPTQNVSLKLSK